jgi:hypothetical protein
MTKQVTCPHKNRKHFGKGMCSLCYQKDYYAKNREKLLAKTREYKRKKYNTDMVYKKKERERTKKAVMKHYWKQKAINPKLNALKQRKYRKNHPDTFNYLMARFYAKRLSKEKRIKLFEELNGYD